MQFAMKNAVYRDQLGEQVKYLIDTLVRGAFDALLIKQPAAHRRVALDLHPFLGLFTDLACQGS